MLTPAATRRDPLILSMSERLGIKYCPVCKQDTIPLPSGICAWCSTYIVFKDDPEGEAA